METPSHADIIKRIDELEVKVDHLCDLMQQADGAFTLLKWMGSVVLGIVTIWAALHNWWRQ